MFHEKSSFLLGKLTISMEPSPSLMGKLTISVAILNSYVNLPEGHMMNWYKWNIGMGKYSHSPSVKHRVPSCIKEKPMFHGISEYPLFLMISL